MTTGHALHLAEALEFFHWWWANGGPWLLLGVAGLVARSVLTRAQGFALYPRPRMWLARRTAADAAIAALVLVAWASHRADDSSGTTTADGRCE